MIMITVRHRGFGGGGDEAGRIEYLTKPFGLDELRSVLERAREEIKEQAEKRSLRERATLQPRLWRHRGPLAGDGEALPHYRQGGAEHPSGPDPGRERHGQGAGGALHSFLRDLQGQALHSGGLRLAGAHPDRE